MLISAEISLIIQGDQVNIDVKQSRVEYLVTDTRARNASYDLWPAEAETGIQVFLG